MSGEYTYKELLERKGVSLAQLGLHEYALSRADALRAVELLEAASVPVVGGDVYFDRGEHLESAYANWFSQQRPGEPYPLFVARSCAESRTYISAFPDRPGVVPMFVLVPGD